MEVCGDYGVGTTRVSESFHPMTEGITMAFEPPRQCLFSGTRVRFWDRVFRLARQLFAHRFEARRRNLDLQQAARGVDPEFTAAAAVGDRIVRRRDLASGDGD